MEEKRYDSIVRQYRNILALISRYLVISSALLAAFLIFRNVFLNPTYMTQREDPFVLQKIELIGKFENMLKQAQQGTDIQTYIIQGPLQTKNQVILSQDNLISYKGIILPRLFSMDTTQTRIQPLSYFSTPYYNSGEMDHIVSDLILKTYETLPPILKNIQLTVDTSLKNTFNLSCVFTNKVYQATCDYYINNFLSSFFVFNLSLDYVEFADIFSHLQGNKKHFADFCTNLQKYLLYTNDVDESIKLLFDQCGQDAKDFFKRMENFIDIQNQLKQGFINTDVYKDSALNAYKLLSYQQILYRDMQNNRILYNQYLMYLNFIKELLKSPHALEHFYYDEMYRFSTYYLKPALQGTRYESRIGGIKDDQISSIIKLIDTTNFGDSLGEFTGLIAQVYNKTILAGAPTTSGAQTDIPLQDKIIKKLKYISYLQIDPPRIQNNQATLSGVILIGDVKVPISLELTYLDDTFYVRSISLPQYPRLLAALKVLFTNKMISLGDLYSAITKNFSFYQNDDIVASGGVSSPCNDINLLQTTTVKITACSADHLVIEKTFSTNSGSQMINYTFFLNNYIPSTIVVSDPVLQKNITDQIPFDASRSLTGLISDVLNVPLHIAVVQTDHEGTANMISVLESFQKYLAIKPNDIAERSGRILVDFSIKGINFLGYYKAPTHVLDPLFFKSVGAQGAPLIIQGASITLDDAHQDTISLFLLDPLNYVKAIDSSAWRNYLAPAKP